MTPKEALTVSEAQGSNIYTPKLIGRKTSWTTKQTTETSNCNHRPETTGDLIQDIYREHLQHRQIIINEVITDQSVSTVALQIMKFNEEDDERTMCEVGYDRMSNPITLKISSDGGHVDAGLAIISQIVSSNTPVIGVAVGDCSSMSALILISCHARFCSKYARIMLHSLFGGNADKFKGLTEYAENVTKIQAVLDSIVTDRTLITQKELDEMHDRKRDWFLSSSEAVELGVVDEVLEVGIQMSPMKARKKNVKAAGKGKGKVED